METQLTVQFNRPRHPSPGARPPPSFRTAHTPRWDRSDLPHEWYMHQKSVQGQTSPQNWSQQQFNGLEINPASLQVEQRETYGMSGYNPGPGSRGFYGAEESQGFGEFQDFGESQRLENRKNFPNWIY